jgi:ribosomal protein RSM22 (predicted rRNA methylase)
VAWTAPPPEISGEIAKIAARFLGGELRARAERISLGFRSGQGSRETIREEVDALAYALTRLPATYAAARAVLGRMREERPDFAPRSLIDAGCGLGVAALAALEVWPEIEAATLLDRNPPFLALARRLLGVSPHPALSSARFVEGDIAAPPKIEAADLVLANYALTELPEAALCGAGKTLWGLECEALVVVEPGTPRNHQRLMRLRAALVGEGARVAMPCPHAAPCPLQPPDWCHFAVRLPRSRDHKALKSADAPFEDEKFSYLVLTRRPGDGAISTARVLAPPRFTKWGARLRLCAPGGLIERNFEKRHKEMYLAVRNKEWGDPVAAPEESPE